MKQRNLFFASSLFALMLLLASVTAIAQSDAPVPRPLVSSALLLEETVELMNDSKYEEGLRSVTKALEQESLKKDLVGYAQAQQWRARALTSLKRNAEAGEAWKVTAVAWEAAGDGPNRMAALLTASILIKDNPEETKKLLATALIVGREETKRPIQASVQLTNIGVALFKDRKLNEALSAFQAALVIQERINANPQLLATTLGNLGSAASALGNNEAAENYHKRALEIETTLKTDSLEVANNEENLGNIAYNAGNDAEAEKHYQNALQIRRKRAPDSKLVASTLNNLGSLANSKHSVTKALAYFEEALAILDKLETSDANSIDNSVLLNKAVVLANIGSIYQDQLQPKKAEQLYKRALELQERIALGSVEYTFTLSKLGQLYKSLGNPKLAEEYMLKAWKSIRNYSREIVGDAARQAFDEEQTHRVADQLISFYTSAKRPDAALLILEEGRAQSLQQLVSERAVLQTAKSSAIWSRYENAANLRDAAIRDSSDAVLDLRRADIFLKRAKDEQASPDKLKAFEQDYRLAEGRVQATRAEHLKWQTEADQLWAEIKNSVPRAFIQPLTIEQAQKSLPADSVAIIFSVSNQAITTFVVLPNAPVQAFTFVAAPDALANTIEDLRGEIITKGDNAVELGRGLYQILFSEAHKHILTAKRVIISPDGPLWRLPFAALVMNEKGAPQYLGLRKPLTYTQSLSVLAQSRNDKAMLVAGANPTTLIVGDPAFDRETTGTPVASEGNAVRGTGDDAGTTRSGTKRGSGRGFLFNGGKAPKRLPATKTEAERVAKLYGSTPILGDTCTEKEMRQHIEKADIIHLATHGFLHPTLPMASGVLLTPPAQAILDTETNDDGALQAWEIFSQLRLRAEIAILSACETGLGKNVRGEGVIGMTRALQYAGCRSIVASHWKVADDSTAELMVVFHEALRGGSSKDAAMLKAMLAVAQNAKTAAPYYWAPFFLTGDPSNGNLGK